MYTQEMLEKAISDLGISKDDLLTVHTSLKAVGEIDTTVKSSAEVLIDALKNCVNDGLLMIPAHTFTNIIEEAPVFNIRETKPCIGAMPCVAVQLANKAVDSGDNTCIRSLHVSHSIVAFGKNAKAFAELDRASRTKNPMTGCYGKLYYDGGKILLIGVDLTKNTFIHAIDESLSDKIYRTLIITVTDYDGSTWDQELHLNDAPGSSTFSRYAIPLETAGAITHGKIGDADSMVIDARKCFEVISEIRKSEIVQN